MTRTCCKYFTVSLVPVSALLLALLFACGILALPVIYTELARKHEVSMRDSVGLKFSTPLFPIKMAAITMVKPYSLLYRPFL